MRPVPRSQRKADTLALRTEVDRRWRARDAMGSAHLVPLFHRDRSPAPPSVEGVGRRIEAVAARYRVLLLPGGVLPAEPAYAALLQALGERVDAFAKDLEVYARDQRHHFDPPHRIEPERLSKLLALWQRAES